MNKIIRKLKRTKKVVRYIYYVLIVAYLISFFSFALSLIHLSGIETLLRTIIIIIFGVYFLLYVMWNLVNLIIRNYKTFIITSLISIVFIAIFLVGSYYINIIYNGLSNMGEDSKVEYTTYLITMKDIEFDSDSKIGRINDKDDIAGYSLAEKLYIKEKLSNEIVDYNDYIFMLRELYSGNIDAVFVPSTYVILYNTEEGFSNIENETKKIYEYSEKMKNQDATIVSDKDFSEPLTFLVMGVDSEQNGLNANAAFNGDTLMLASFNPSTLKTTIVSIPRDTYVPIACRSNAYAKINSAAASGTNCVIDTVSNFLDVQIDYYVKINFKGVVELVDAVGGVDVDVEAPSFSRHNALKIDCGGRFCEQNSNRGDSGKDIIYLDPGFQTLNGEEALAYSRCRYLYVGGDLDRIRHQQAVVEALASKLLSFDSVSNFQKILNAVSNNMITNMSTDKILSGYNTIKKMLNNALNGDELVTINKAYLETYGLNVYVPSQKMNTSAQGYYKDSLEDIQKALKETLGILNEEVVKTFAFSVNEEYQVTSPGKGLRTMPSGSVLPNFVGKTVTDAEEFCDKNNIDLSIRYVDPGSDYYNPDIAVGLIGSQSVHENVLLSTVEELTVYIVNSEKSSGNNNNDDNKNNSSSSNNKHDDLDGKKDDDENNDVIDRVIEDLLE